MGIHSARCMGIARGLPKFEPITATAQSRACRLSQRERRTMKHIFESTLFYSPRTASAAFSPPCGEHVIRRGIRLGYLQTLDVGRRKYIKRDELIRAAEAGELK